MAFLISVLLASLPIIQASFVLDPSFPAPFNLNISSVSAITVANGIDGKEIHVSQRGPEAAPLLVFNTKGVLLRSQGNS
jgi:hypothetical protein